VYVVVEVKNQR